MKNIAVALEKLITFVCRNKKVIPTIPLRILQSSVQLRFLGIANVLLPLSCAVITLYTTNPSDRQYTISQDVIFEVLYKCFTIPFMHEKKQQATIQKSIPITVLQLNDPVFFSIYL